MSYVNYWTTEPYVSRNGDFGVMGNSTLKPLIDSIDFDSWIFSNHNRDGIFELAKQLDSFQPDEFHPGNQANQKWAEFITRCIPSIE
jgi:hypothetical protein